LIETRGEGNYVLLPGSPSSCHPAGKPYKLIRGDFSKIPWINATERKRLLKTARQLDEVPKEVTVRRKPRTSQGDRPGDYFNREMNWEEILTPYGWEMVGKNGETSHWQRPEKDGEGLSATTNHGGSGLLYVFSTNAHPFEAGKSYSKFAAYALLNHGGDFKAAAESIAFKKSEQSRTAENPPTEPEATNPVESRSESLASHIVDAVSRLVKLLFHDQFQKPHAYVPIDNHFEIWPCRGIQFKRFISKTLWDAERTAPSADAITAALGVLESMACFEGDEITLHNRVAYHQGSIYCDLADQKWRAIRVSDRGWKIIERPPNPFPPVSSPKPAGGTPTRRKTGGLPSIHQCKQ
jgi:hypothetical protein